jgi:TolB-like protein
VSFLLTLTRKIGYIEAVSIMQNSLKKQIVCFLCIIYVFILSSGYSQETKPVLTVLDFETSGITKQEARLIVDYISSHIVESGKYRVINRMERQAFLKELEWSVSDCSDTKCQLQLGRMLAASFIVVGSLGSVGNKFMININLIDVETGETLSTASQVYKDINSLIEDNKRLISEFLGITSTEETETIDADSQFVTVDNVGDFIKAIESDVVIRLEAGEYNISDGYRYQNKHIQWKDNYDGLYPVVRSLSNLHIIGMGEVRIVIDPAYGWVMEFKTCTGISFDNITLGHTEPGYCVGGVLRFSVCDTIDIENCTLYGSGTVGIGLEKVNNVVFNNSIIKECTYGLMDMIDSGNIRFTNSHFTDTGEFTLIELSGNTRDVSFQSCDFVNNHGQTFISVSPECNAIELNGCLFKNNRAERFVNNKTLITIKECQFYDNHFQEQ